MLPDTYLDALSYDACLARWTSALVQRARQASYERASRYVSGSIPRYVRVQPRWWVVAIDSESAGTAGRTTTSERDVGVRTAVAVVVVTDDLRQSGACHVRGDDLVDDTDLYGLVHSAGDPLVLSCQLRLDGGQQVAGHLGELATVQDPYGRHGAHDGDLSARPGEHRGRAERARVHRDVRAAVRLARDERDARHDALGEGVEELRAPPYDAVPLLALSLIHISEPTRLGMI